MSSNSSSSMNIPMMTIPLLIVYKSKAEPNWNDYRMVESVEMVVESVEV